MVPRVHDDDARRTHSECAGRARAVLQDSLAAAMVRGAPELWSGKRADARDAARPIAAAAITAIADGREPTGAPEALAALRPLLSRPLLPPEQHKLLLPLLRLRQACIHPQVCVLCMKAAEEGQQHDGMPGCSVPAPAVSACAAVSVQALAPLSSW